MTRFLADENFDNRIIRGLLRHLPEIDIVRVQDVGLINADDPEILSWAAVEKRVLLTHDVATMTAFAYKRIAEDLPMAGIFEVPKKLSISEAIEQLVLIAQYSLENEWEGQVRFLPLR
ncbi:MAG TPA: DUF5615 family PIN-like protein [Pyrinomonadaceae bacterium]|nr:DUF5615 family PIN-like protein [Pyrinomonadaceae bacterium]